MQDGKEYYLIERKRSFLWMKFWAVITVGQDYEKVNTLYETEYKPFND